MDIAKALSADKSSKKKKRQKKEEKVENKGSLSLTQSDHKPIYRYDPNWENKNFLDVVGLLDYKAILYNVPGQPIALSNGYAGYLQILEIKGTDVEVLSQSEQVATILGYMKWLSGSIFDFAEQTTTLPTNTNSQLGEKRALLDEVRQQLLNPELPERTRVQLTHRHDILKHNIMVDEIVGQEQYNTEFFFWIYGNTLDELESYVRLSNTLSTSFKPQPVSAEKKEQILKQYNNSNEKV